MISKLNWEAARLGGSLAGDESWVIRSVAEAARRLRKTDLHDVPIEEIPIRA